jgi:N-acyl-L-homoserine lactone synthetase
VSSSPPVEQGQYARALDRLTQQVLANLAPLRFEAARTAADEDAVLRMRYACVVEMGWRRAEDFPDGRERDEYDDGAAFIVCRDGAALVGTLRLVLPELGRPLPVERDFGIRVEPPGEALDAGRLVIAAGYRGGPGHPVLAGLFCRCWLEARRLGYSRLVAAAPAKTIDLYRDLGLGITVLGPPQAHWGEERTPIEIAGGDKTFASLAAADPPIRRPGAAH